MSNLVRGIVFAVVAAGIFAVGYPQAVHSQGASVAGRAIPIPVCPPNDPDACHIDQK